MEFEVDMFEISREKWMCVMKPRTVFDTYQYKYEILRMTSTLLSFLDNDADFAHFLTMTNDKDRAFSHIIEICPELFSLKCVHPYTIAGFVDHEIFRKVCKCYFERWRFPIEDELLTELISLGKNEHAKILLEEIVNTSPEYPLSIRDVSAKNLLDLLK